MMKVLFEILSSTFDWITPTVGFVETFSHDPTPLQLNSHTFYVDYDSLLASGWNANEIKQVLKDHGIDSWGSQIIRGTFHFTIYDQQEQDARNLFSSRSIPIV